MKYKLFGLQRTCTNWARHVMREFFDSEDCEKGREWKHGYIQQSGKEEDIVLLICSKNIHSWMRSVWQYFHRFDPTNCKKFNKEWTLSEFIHNPHYEFANPIQRWNVMNRHYLDFHNLNKHRSFWIRSEDILIPEAQIKQAKIFESLFKLKKPFEPVIQRLNNNCTLNRHDFEPKYYLSMEYMKLYSQEDLDFIDKNVDKQLDDILGHFGN